MSIPRQPGMNIANGVDTITWNTRNTAINYDRIEDMKNTETGAIHEVEQELHEVSNNQSVSRMFGGELGVSIIGIPVGGGAKLMSGMRFSQNKKYFATCIQKVTMEKSLVSPYLSDEAIDVLNGRGSQGFINCYGDEFIKGFQYGGKLCVIMEISAKGEKKFLDLGCGVINEALNFCKNLLNISVNVNAAYEKISEHFEMSFHASQHGGTSDWQPRSIEELKQYIDKFLKEVEQRPVAINAITSSYKDLAYEYDMDYEYELIYSKKTAIESVANKILAMETYLTRLNNAEYYEKNSSATQNIYDAKEKVHLALDSFNTWLQTAIYTKGTGSLATIPDFSIINDIKIKEVPFY